MTDRSNCDNSLSRESRSAWRRRQAFLWRAALVVVIAAAGEIAAVAAASAMHLGPTVTCLALGGVVLTAVWPLCRFTA
jgi:hypothetical protein